MIEERFAARARKARFWACLGWALYAALVWVPSPQLNWLLEAAQLLTFLFAYLLLTWSLILLMAAKRQPRWWGYLGLLGPVGLLLYFVPSRI